MHHPEGIYLDLSYYDAYMAFACCRFLEDAIKWESIRYAGVQNCFSTIFSVHRMNEVILFTC